MSLEKQILQPDIVIGGAPKCGTTSLFNWLNIHPDILGSDPKETHFFMDEGHPLLRSSGNLYHHGLSAYDKFFPKENRLNKNFALEASAHYLYQNKALEFFSQCEAKPKCIFALRQPSKMIFSAFNYLKNNRAEIDPKLEFSEFIQLALDNNFIKIKSYCYTEHSFIWLSSLLEYGDYEKWLKLWFDSMPDNVQVVIFEELIHHPRHELKFILEFLGLSDSYLAGMSFDAENKTETYRYLLIHKIIRKSYVFLNDLNPQIKFPESLKVAYKNLFTVSKKNTAESDALKTLDNYFLDSNKRLEGFLGRKIDCWKTFT